MSRSYVVEDEHKVAQERHDSCSKMTFVRLRNSSGGQRRFSVSSSSEEEPLYSGCETYPIKMLCALQKGEIPHRDDLSFALEIAKHVLLKHARDS